MNEIRFIDLFSGIGGFRLGLEKTNKSLRCLQSGDEGQQNSGNNTPQFHEGEQERISNNRGFKHVWSNDINKYANQIYTTRFGEEAHYSGDIRGVDARQIPDHDLLCGGFPCQAFSVAGKRRGFEETRGTLFFEICRIAEHHRPRLLLLENVKGLLSHDGGRTFATILNTLEELGYWWEYQVLNSKHFGVPQNRERVFIIGHLREGSGREVFPISENTQSHTKEGEIEEGIHQIASTIGADDYPSWRGNFVSRAPLKFLGRNEVNWIKDEAYTVDSSNTGEVIIHNLYGGFGENIRTFENYSPTIRTAKGGGHIPSVLKDARIRKLTPIECERLQGFPDDWTEGISDTQRYKCLGNAVTVNVIEFLGKLILEAER